MDDNSKKEIIARLTNLTEVFRASLRNVQPRDGRRPIESEHALKYIRSYIQESTGIPTEEIHSLPAIDLSGIEFIHSICLPAGEYPGVNISNSKFDSDVLVEDSTFHGGFKLENVVQLGGGQSIEFKRTRFSKIHLHSCDLPSAVWRDVAIMSPDKDINITACKFHEFRNVRFSGKTVLNNSAINLIEDCEFYGSVQWTINGFVISITRSNFHDDILLNGNINSVIIEDAAFRGAAKFESTIFVNRAAFRGVEFLDSVSFNNAKFTGPVYFENTRFTDPPKFYGVEMFPDASLRTCTFEKFDTVEGANAYRELREHFPAEDGRFFAYEQRALANASLNDGLTLAAVLSKLYDWISEYGQNIVKPMWWLLGAWLFFGFLYWHAEMAYQAIKPTAGASAWAQNFSPWLGYSIQNLVNPLGIFSRTVQYEAQLWWVAGLALAESLFSTIILALWFLAVRRRFRKGSE